MEEVTTKKIYGYVRLSTKDQNGERQMIAMNEMGVPKQNIYIDKQSGKDFVRPRYKRLVRMMKKEDLLYIKSIDRLERNYTEILEQGKLVFRTNSFKLRQAGRNSINIVKIGWKALGDSHGFKKNMKF